MPKRSVLSAIAGAAIAVVAVAGCTSSGSSSSGGSKGELGVATQAHGLAPAYATNARPANADGVTGYVGAPANTSATAKSLLLSDTASVIRRAQLTVAVAKASDIAGQADQAEAIVTQLGGEVFGDDRTSGTNATAALTLKVPPDSLITALDKLSALGKEKSRTLSSQDVTTQVADVDARVQSAAASIARLRALYSSATKVGDVISIEGELATREADLESLQAQQKTLASETQEATISLELTTATAPVVVKPQPKHHSDNAFVKGWHHFTAGGGWLITVLVSVGPFVLLAGLIAFGVLWARRRRITPAAA